MRFSDARRRAIAETTSTGKWMYVLLNPVLPCPHYAILNYEGVLKHPGYVILGYAKTEFDNSMNPRVRFVEESLVEKEDQ